MKRLFFSSTLAASLISFSAVAQPPETTFWTKIGNWVIMHDNTIKGSCFATSSFADGTGLRLGFFPRGSKFPAYLTFTNPTWKSIQVGKEYPVSIQFDTSPLWNAVASGWNLDNRPGVLVNVDDANLVEQFVKGKQLSLSFKGVVAANLALIDSGRAVQEMANCQHMSETGKPLDIPKKDPFSVQDVNPNTDPFGL